MIAEAVRSIGRRGLRFEQSHRPASDQRLCAARDGFTSVASSEVSGAGIGLRLILIGNPIIRSGPGATILGSLGFVRVQRRPSAVGRLATRMECGADCRTALLGGGRVVRSSSFDVGIHEIAAIRRRCDRASIALRYARRGRCGLRSSRRFARAGVLTRSPGGQLSDHATASAQ